MKTINLKKETTKARKRQIKTKKLLEEAINYTKKFIDAEQEVLDALKNLQDPLDILIDDENDFEEKAKAFKTLSELFDKQLDVVELSWKRNQGLGNKYRIYAKSMFDLMSFDIVNAIDKKSAKQNKLVFFENPEEIINEMGFDNENVKWIDDL